MIKLLSVVAGNGSQLHLGVLLDEEQRAPETNVPKDGALAARRLRLGCDLTAPAGKAEVWLD